jgi:hypothetical protein
MKLFAAEVLPEFKERESIREKVKEREMASFIEEANKKARTPQSTEKAQAIDAYPLMWKKMSSADPEGKLDRRPGMTAFWQMQTGGKGSKKK